VNWASQLKGPFIAGRVLRRQQLGMNHASKQIGSFVNETTTTYHHQSIPTAPEISDEATKEWERSNGIAWQCQDEQE